MKQDKGIRIPVELVSLSPQLDEGQRLLDLAIGRVEQGLGMTATGRVVLTLDSPSGAAAKRAATLGHFAPLGYVDREGQRYHQIALNPYHIVDRSAADIVETLMHEAIHVVAFCNDVKDTSRQGRYHGQVFQNLVNKIPELGFDKDKKIGCTTYLSEVGKGWAAECHPSAELLNLGKAIETPPPAKVKTTHVLVCAADWPCDADPLKITVKNFKRYIPELAVDVDEGELTPPSCGAPCGVTMRPVKITDGEPEAAAPPVGITTAKKGKRPKGTVLK